MNRNTRFVMLAPPYFFLFLAHDNFQSGNIVCSANGWDPYEGKSCIGKTYKHTREGSLSHAHTNLYTLTEETHSMPQRTSVYKSHEYTNIRMHTYKQKLCHPHRYTHKFAFFFLEWNNDKIPVRNVSIWNMFQVELILLSKFSWNLKIDHFLLYILLEIQHIWNH